MQAFPLSWPPGWRRTKASDRIEARFSKGEIRYGTPDSNGHKNSWMQKRSLTVSDAIGRVLYEIGMLGVERGDMVISTNVQTRLDGLPYSNRNEPQDPGAAVYWRKNGQMKCMAIDQYTKVAGNLAAIAATLTAMRAIGRYSNAEILDRAFLGFAALPPPNRREWWEVLGFGNGGVTLDDATERYKLLAKRHHPDMGGEAAKFAELSEAITNAREALGAR